METQEKVLCLRKNMSIRKIAKLCLVSHATISRIEKGEAKEIRATTFKAIDQLYKQQLAKYNRAKKKDEMK